MLKFIRLTMKNLELLEDSLFFTLKFDKIFLTSKGTMDDEKLVTSIKWSF